ncbi:MAG TPA: M56 family metallopeptidase, partial [Pirellulales bacterium]|nr:M56 family metallopeptidase [Pirellulales bacterium]
MNRTLLTVAGLSGASSLLLVDSAIKGMALLALAAIAALVLRRDSAATRHLVWMLAIVAMLVVPVLSAMLPQWRVLPQWARISLKPAVADSSPPSIAGPAERVGELPQMARPDEVERPSATAYQPAAYDPAANRPAAGPADSRPAWIGELAGWNWTLTLPLAWAIGFFVLILRLLAARWILYRLRSESRPPSQSTIMGSSAPDAKATHDAILSAVETVCRQLGIARPVTLWIHPDKTIPVVWGILRSHLLLPAAARNWSGEQLRSVLLHELAHIKRRDTMAQLLTQMACALYWFNPLVWFAAWRLGVERERACDDLVLASGVRPSAYASHLLEIVTQLSPTRWTQPCGLAMAHKSSLESRLTAVLSGSRNRRGLTRVLVAAAVVLAAAVAIPLAMLRAMEPDRPKIETAAANTDGTDAEPKDAAPKDSAPKDDAPKDAGPKDNGPKDDESRPLFENWKTSARTDGKIPGGRIGEMAASLKSFMDLNPGHEQSVKLQPVLEKCDALRDWTPAEAAALLDEIAEITPRAPWTMRANSERQIHPGKPLTVELADAPWGEPAANGLRMAWLLEPRARTQALDSVLRSRVLFHNSGEKPVCFATEDSIQSGGHKANDAHGNEIGVWAVSRLGLRLRMVFRLAPGEYAEVAGHGLGVGPHETASEQSIYKVGCWIEAKLNDEVTFNPANVPVSFQTWQNNEGLKDSTTVWREMITARVAQESPMPAAAADREQLLRRVTKDLLGTEPSAEEIATFINDDAPDALAKLTARLQTTAGAMHFAGELAGGTTEFRVTASAPKKVEPNRGAKLRPGTQEKLEWGQPVNGLRMALAWPPALGEPAAGDVPDFYLAVQNVSAAPVRLCTTAEAPNQRRLTFSTSGVPQGR